MIKNLIHLDADAFFASVEQAADPRLRGKPVAVGGEKRGIIASASYEARRAGIYTPMPTARARRLCPKLILLPGDFEKYEHFSRWMFSYAYDFTPDVEITSIDEGYFDLTGARQSPVDIAQTIRKAIRQSLKLTVSEGIASSKLVSQIASKLDKPAAFTQVPHGTETDFLHPLPNRWLPGVGPQTASRLNAAGLQRIGQIATTPPELLQLLLGRWAVSLQEYARGIDDRPIVPVSGPAKSYSHQETFAEDQTDEPFIEATLRHMADRLMARIRAEGKSIRTVTVKVRYNDMDEDQCGESLPEPTDLETDLYTRLGLMLRRAWKRRVSLRLVSLKFSNIYDSFSPGLLPLESNAKRLNNEHRLAALIDDLRHKHGSRVIVRGHDLILRQPPPRRSATRQKKTAPPPARRPRPARPKPFLPLAVHSYYSFLNATLSPEAIIALARQHELPAVALTDQNNLHGAVPFTQAARAAGIRPILGATTRLNNIPVRLYVQNATGYHNLCRLLSEEGRRKEEGGTQTRDPDASSSCNPPSSFNPEGLLAVAEDIRLAPLFPNRFYQAVSSAKALRELETPSRRRWPAVAVIPVHYGTPRDQSRFHIVQSIRTLTLLRQSHPGKDLTGRFHFRSRANMARLFANHPDLLERTAEIAGRCPFELTLGPPQFPAFATPDGSDSRTFLRRLVFEGLRRRYAHHKGSALTDRRAQVEQELGIIHEVGYEDYFLVVWDILQGCRQHGIDWITRGSAADSLVCYCLGISDVCPIRFDLYFHRFLNKERMSMQKLPDIDVDFPHDRKDDVVELAFEKYGREHAAVVGGFSTFRARSAMADIAKVLGVSEHQVRQFTKRFPWTNSRDLAETLKSIPDSQDLPIEEDPYKTALEMAAFLDGFPRYPKMHPCGIVLSRQSMHELTPTFESQKGYPTTHFDMDAVEAIGLVKIDILAQGGLAAMRDVEQELSRQKMACRMPNTEGLTPSSTSSFRNPPSSVPFGDPEIWEMIASGGARAVHHIESPAMIGLCRMANVHDIDGLIAIVSVIRPGAANEQKKVQFTRRYQGLEPPAYPHPCLEPYLRSTFGLVVYEEHILQICVAFAGMSLGRGDTLRRGLVKMKPAIVNEIETEFIAGARARGHDDATIETVWNLVRGFAGYAFCKAHSTAYGVEAYQSAWLKHYHPAEFMAAVLTNGKGFYHPIVYVLETLRLGIPFLPPCINAPGPGFHVETGNAGLAKAIRVPVTRVKGMTGRTQKRIVAERKRGRFESLRDFYRRVVPLPDEMEAMLRVGAFDGFGQSRTRLFWEIQFLRHTYGPGCNPAQGWLLPPGAEGGRRKEDPDTSSACLLPSSFSEPSHSERLDWEMALLDFTASGHPLERYNDIDWDSYCPVSEMGRHAGKTIVTCGLVIEQRIHHQVTGEPMKFLTLADRTGMVETELFASTYRSYGLATVRYPVLEVTATVEPFENGRGFTLRVHRAGEPRKRMKPG